MSAVNKPFRGLLVLLLGLWIQAGVQASEQRERIDFSLTTDQGVWQFNSLRGKMVMLVFGYTHCPDVCPTSLQILAEAFDQLSPELQQQVQGVFVSVDPDRDDPVMLRDYGSYFHPNITGVTGTKAELDQLTSQIGVHYRLNQGEDGDYSVDHATLTFVIDPEGYKVKVLVSHAAPPDYVAQLVRDTLAAPQQEQGQEQEDG